MTYVPPAAWSTIATTPVITVSRSPTNDGSTWGVFNAVNADKTGLNDASNQSVNLLDTAGLPATVPVVIGHGVFVASATEHLRQAVPIIAFSWYSRNDNSHTTGTDIFPVAAGFTGTCLWDTNYDGVSVNKLLPTLALVGVICEANATTIDGIHLDNPDHATLDHVQLRGFANGMIADALNITLVAKVPGEIELRMCVATSCTALGFETIGMLGSNAGGGTAPLVFTNVYLWDCHVQQTGTTSFRFVNTSNLQAFGLWADGYSTAGIEFRAQNADLQGAVFTVGSMRVYGVHLIPTAGTDLVESNDGLGFAHVQNFITGPGARVIGGECGTQSNTNVDNAIPNVRLWITDVDGLNYNGSGYLTPPAVPATTVLQGNIFPFSVDVWIQGGTGTVINVRSHGTTNPVYSQASAAFAGVPVRLAPGERISITYTAAPTWLWKCA